MSEIRLLTEAELPLFAKIGVNAYPGLQRTPEQVLEMYQRNFERPHIHIWGLFANGELLGAFQQFDFLMTVLDQPVTVGGIGGVGVDLLHKKQRVAYRLLQHFLQQCRTEKKPLTWLYPFRPDFYRRMGFGYGSKMNYYRLDPKTFPRTGSAEQTRFVDAEDRVALIACYNRYTDATNGMIRRHPDYFDYTFNKPEVRCVACWDGDHIRGYAIYHYQATPGNLLSSDMHIRELIYETPAALAELLTFVHLQLDQTARVLLNTHDEFLAHLFDNPLNGSNQFVAGAHESNTQGVGLMLRVVDVPGLFTALEHHDFGGQTIRLRLDLIDDFLPENEGQTILHFVDGEPHLMPDGTWDVTLRLHVRHFSPLVVGAVNLRWLVQVGLAEVDNRSYLNTLDRLFSWHQKPICMTGF